jgi:ATP-dependent protease ClpP protease subunit
MAGSGMRFEVTNRTDQDRIRTTHKGGPRPDSNVRNSWYQITNLATAPGHVEVFVYDEIGFRGVTAAEFCQQLQSLEAVHIDLRINSPGGDVFDGIAIYNALCSHPASVTTWVDGIAASAASFIAQAGGRVVIARNATMMIHDAEGVCIGNAADMAEMEELLNRTSDNIADIYAQRCSTVSVWRRQMRAVSWYVGQEAIDAGLADEVYEPEQGTEGEPAERRRRATNRLPQPVNGRASGVVDMACPQHSTATTDEGTWDANAEQGKLDSPMSMDTAKKMYAYIDEGRKDDDGKVPKDACSLPHHTVGDGGTPAAAHMAGVRNALARLEQTDIPDSEKDAARAHLNKHLADGGGEPGEGDGGSAEDSGQLQIVASGDGEFATWWNPDIFRTAVGVAADQRALYGFDADVFRDAIRAVAEDMPALPDERPVSRELPPSEPTITPNEFEAAIRRGMM